MTAQPKRITHRASVTVPLTRVTSMEDALRRLRDRGVPDNAVVETVEMTLLAGTKVTVRWVEVEQPE